MEIGVGPLERPIHFILPVVQFTGVSNGLANWQGTVFRITEPAFNWTDDNFQRPSSDRLVIYEALVRDFDEGQVFQDLMDRLDYLEYMGFNAIELMPVSEFEGNLS